MPRHRGGFSQHQDPAGRPPGWAFEAVCGGLSTHGGFAVRFPPTPRCTLPHRPSAPSPKQNHLENKEKEVPQRLEVAQPATHGAVGETKPRPEATEPRWNRVLPVVLRRPPVSQAGP